MNGVEVSGRVIRFRALQRLAVALGVGVLSFLVFPAWISLNTRLIASWDLSALVYLGLAWQVIVRSNVTMTRDHALSQDQSRHVMFLFVVTAAFAGMVAIGFLANSLKGLEFWPRAWHLTLSIVALISSWLLIQTVFAFHYARRYYAPRHRAQVQPAGVHGLEFPGGVEPDYLDFAYYSFVVGMTSQVSDVPVTSRPMRHLTLIHSVLAFIFNIAILALSINIIASVI